MYGFGRLSDFLTAQIVPLSVLFGALLLAFAVLYFSGVSRHRRMAAERRGEDVDSFVLYLASYGFDPDIARTTYEYLVAEEDVAFPIRHTDRLDHDLRISEEEVRKSVRYLLKEFGREASPGMQHMPLVTVEDLLRFVQACPTVGSSFSGQHRVAGSSANHKIARSGTRQIAAG